MTNSNFSLRPEDFRFAWANAYQHALVHVAEMQRCADTQLKAVKDLIQLGSEQTEFSRLNLQKTAGVIVQELQQAAQENEKRIDAATRGLLAQAQGLFDKEVALRAQTAEMVLQLAHDRRELERDKKALFGQSLGQRLWLAFKYKG